jgi:hypothetical protein
MAEEILAASSHADGLLRLCCDQACRTQDGIESRSSSDVSRRSSSEIIRTHWSLFSKLRRPSASAFDADSVAKIESRIGQGAFGDVFKALLRTGRQVAVKRMLSENGARDTHEREMLEFIASHGVHRNIIHFLGGYGSRSSRHGPTVECLVMELMPMDLATVLGGKHGCGYTGIGIGSFGKQVGGRTCPVRARPPRRRV